MTNIVFADPCGAFFSCGKDTAEAVKAKEFKRYELLTSDKNIDKSSLPLLKEAVPSVIACIVKCEVVPECRYIFFSKKSSECIFHSKRKAVVPSFQHWRVTCRRFDYAYEDPTGTCFKEHGDALTWQDASDACTADGGHLLTLDTADDNTISLFQGTSIGMWVGATDSAVEGEFRWLVTGDLLSSSLPWDTNQPDGGNAEQCVRLIAQTSTSNSGEAQKTLKSVSSGTSASPVKLHDEDCGQLLPYVCEL
ncbi:uncharacterized protein LOC110442270 [Mizuhopecten yessoensis]|uniref:uncharacterized protein LOC110442270 n=1 Tax=Mizuhopecten yessoensis TaxID=6573 RepID=UPI000B45EB91|nr:uncharacterized protein LOC110442270 [Mizuhopecten yessoensis]